MFPGRPAWDKRQRLLRAPEFAAFIGPHAPLQAPWRAARRWIAMSALIHPRNTEAPAPPPAAPADAAPVRFGFTISKRQARRAVARNTVKRILRESARHASAALVASAGGRRVDVLLRLKATLPPPSAATWSEVKRNLRAEADDLLEQLRAQLRRAAATEREA